jgi:hypothetical protein
LMTSQRGSRENRAHLANHRSQRDKDRGEGRLLRELDRLGARTQRLRETLEGTERQMQIAGRGGAQVEQLKGRVVTLLGRQMREKTVKFQIQRSIEGVEKKVRMDTEKGRRRERGSAGLSGVSTYVGREAAVSRQSNVKYLTGVAGLVLKDVVVLFTGGGAIGPCGASDAAPQARGPDQGAGTGSTGTGTQGGGAAKGKVRTRHRQHFPPVHR